MLPPLTRGCQGLTGRFLSFLKKFLWPELSGLPWVLQHQRKSIKGKNKAAPGAAQAGPDWDTAARAWEGAEGKEIETLRPWVLHPPHLPEVGRKQQ